MPNRQKHRGQHSSDARLFNEKWIIILRQAVRDLSILLSRGYSEDASLKLVGDRYRLHKRQRQALMRAACADEAIMRRQRNLLDQDMLAQEEIWIDTYNLLITIESLLSDGIILYCRDGCYRDLASVHGTYRKVEETIPAIHLIGQTLAALEVGMVKWHLDSPVSNSGRLKGILLEEAQKHNWNWEAELHNNPDKVLVEAGKVVVSSDSWVIDHALAWFNLVGLIIEKNQNFESIIILG